MNSISVSPAHNCLCKLIGVADDMSEYLLLPAYPEIVSLSTIIACNVMNRQGRTAISFYS